MKIETHTGVMFDYDDPQPEQIRVEDIAHALSLICRFGGHAKRFYSVAEHAVRVRQLVRRAGHDWAGFAALHHDSHEAYCMDIPTPLKVQLGAPYTDLVVEVDRAIAGHLAIPAWTFHGAQVKAADKQALREEANILKASRGVGDHWGFTEPLECEDADWWPGLTPEQAEREFLRVHRSELAWRTVPS